MTLKIPSPYEIKKALMYPRKIYMRHKEKFEPGFMLSAMELHYYRPAFYKWLRAVSENADLLHEADIDANSLVLDVGAYTGEWAQEIIGRYNPRIIAFEPDPKNYKQLAKKSQNNPHLSAYSYGLGDKTEDVRITLEFLGSSIFSGSIEKEGVKWADTKIKDIVETWSELELDRVDLMKINIEGGEYPLFERMIETDMIDKVDCYFIQFHEWLPGAYHRRRKIRKALRKTHKLTWDYHFVWERWDLK
ncbi:MAG: FkbM family methyltransferase [Halioglobus sp.]|jgi:FkbM family methyltransferase